MSSKRRLAILWNAATGASGAGTRMVRISSSASPHRLAVAGEVVGQCGPSAPRRGRSQDQRDVQGQQGGQRVPDRRAGAQVAAEGGSVADQPGGELGEDLGQQRNPSRQAALDLRQGQRRADLDRVVAHRQAAQLVEPVDGDGEGGPGVPDVQLHPPVGGAGHQHRPGMLGQQGQRGRPGRPGGRSCPGRR